MLLNNRIITNTLKSHLYPTSHHAATSLSAAAPHLRTLATKAGAPVFVSTPALAPTLTLAKPSLSPPIPPSAQRVINARKAISARTSVEELMAAEKAIIRNVVENPIEVYADMRGRLEHDGMNASFPEFRPLVNYLMTELKSPRVAGILKANPTLNKQWEIAKTHLSFVGLRFVMADKNYPYSMPYKGELPYRPTLEAVLRVLEFFESVAAVDPERESAPLYHTDRYLYHWGSLVDNPRFVMLPTISPLSFSDFIKTRSVPLAFIGVSTTPLFADRHVNSPLDFAVHDMNHGRRVLGYCEGGLRERGVLGKGLEAETEVFKEWNRFIKDELLPLTDIKDKKGDQRLMARIMRLIAFEILHESAVNPTRADLLKCLDRKAGEPEPFEHLVPPVDNAEALNAANIEGYRAATGNIDSGVRAFDYMEDGLTVRYFKDRAVVLLGNVYNKMAHGFYDPWTDPQSYVTPVEQRTADNVARGAVKFYEFLGEKRDHYSCKAQVLSQKGSEELFTFYNKTIGMPEE